MSSPGPPTPSADASDGDGATGAPPSFLSRVLLGMVRGYQVAISPLFGPRCRFYPSCSAYTVMAIRERGALTGAVLGAYRILRCNPWARGGVDFPPRRGQRWPGRDDVIGRSEEITPHQHQEHDQHHQHHQH